MRPEARVLLTELRRTDPTRLRLLLTVAAGSADPIELALTVDGLHRDGMLTAKVLAWAATERPSLTADEAAIAAELLAAAADLWRGVHHLVEDIGPLTARPSCPSPVMSRLLALADADDCAVEWRSPTAISVAAGYYSPGRIILHEHADAAVLAHELGHHFDPRPPRSIGLAERETFADEFGARLTALHVTSPRSARALARKLVAARDVGCDDTLPQDVQSADTPAGNRAEGVTDGHAPVVLDDVGIVDRLALYRWFEHIATASSVGS